VTGGIKIEETADDLAVLAAMWSSYKEKALLGNTVYVGELSLLGEVKKVSNLEKRRKEAESLGRKLVEIKNVKELKN
jgi:DNA repair protein RadA/Sms